MFLKGSGKYILGKKHDWKWFLCFSQISLGSGHLWAKFAWIWMTLFQNTKKPLRNQSRKQRGMFVLIYLMDGSYRWREETPLTQAECAHVSLTGFVLSCMKLTWSLGKCCISILFLYIKLYLKASGYLLYFRKGKSLFKMKDFLRSEWLTYFIIDLGFSCRLNLCWVSVACSLNYFWV